MLGRRNSSTYILNMHNQQRNFKTSAHTLLRLLRYVCHKNEDKEKNYKSVARELVLYQTKVKRIALSHHKVHILKRNIFISDAS